MILPKKKYFDSPKICKFNSAKALYYPIFYINQSQMMIKNQVLLYFIKKNITIATESCENIIYEIRKKINSHIEVTICYIENI